MSKATDARLTEPGPASKATDARLTEPGPTGKATDARLTEPRTADQLPNDWMQLTARDVVGFGWTGCLHLSRALQLIHVFGRQG